MTGVAGSCRRKSPASSPHSYQNLEVRQLLAALFPTWIDGVFTLGDPVAAAPYNLSDTFRLSTRPGATKTIYLDFDGHHSVNNDWNHNIVFPRYDRDGDNTTFSTAELIELQKIFQNVAEDFAPFDVNVTTIDPGLDALTRTGASDTTWGIRVVHTQATNGFGDSFGGVAFLNSFNDPIDNPCFAINKGVNNGAMTVSHEIGHTFGLRHDGLNSAAYHPGTGTGPTSWGPLMGAPFGRNLVHWSKGEYTGNTNTEDDLALITQAQHGVNFLPDDVGNTTANARPLNMTSATTAFDWAIVGNPTDVDVFRFEAGAGPFTMDIRPFRENPNLDVLATLMDSSGNVIATSNPTDNVTASFNIPDLAAGTYFVSVDGTGLSGIYTDYGSLGFFTVEATLVDPVVPTVRIGDAGVVTGVNHLWKKVNLEHSYTNPVVVAGPATRIGGDPVTIRVRNVTANSFEIRIDEWDYQDGRHSGEEISFLVVEAGVHVLEDGTILQAGIDQTNHRWDYTPFPQKFNSIPVVFTQAMTYNDPAGIVTRQRSITASGFEYRLQEEQAADRFHGMETVGWLAIVRGDGASLDTDFEAVVTGEEVTHLNHTVSFQNSFAQRPVFLASMQSHYGGDPASVRLRTIGPTSATFFLEEEQSADKEMEHNPEVVGYLAMESGPIRIPGDTGGQLAFLSSTARPGNGLFTDVTTDDAILAAALQTIENWGETSLPLGNHDAETGGCCCGSCLSDVGDSIRSDSGLAAARLALGMAEEAGSENGAASVRSEPRAETSSHSGTGGSLALAIKPAAPTAADLMRGDSAARMSEEAEEGPAFAALPDSVTDGAVAVGSRSAVGSA